MDFFKKAGFETKNIFLKCAAVGICAGVLNGLFGSGGGLLLVPFFTDFLKLEQRQAFATSVFVILILCVASVIAYSQKLSIEFNYILPYLLGGIVGGIVGATVLKKLPVNIIRRVFAVFILWAAYKAIFL